MDIPPHKVTQPFQLLASWMVGMVIVVGEFIYLCKNSQEQWLKISSFLGAILLAIIFIGVIFRLQTKYRAEMQDSIHYQQIWMTQYNKELNKTRSINWEEVLKKWQKK